MTGQILDRVAALRTRRLWLAVAVIGFGTAVTLFVLAILPPDSGVLGWLHNLGTNVGPGGIGSGIAAGIGAAAAGGPNYGGPVPLGYWRDDHGKFQPYPPGSPDPRIRPPLWDVLRGRALTPAQRSESSASVGRHSERAAMKHQNEEEW